MPVCRALQGCFRSEGLLLALTVPQGPTRTAPASTELAHPAHQEPTLRRQGRLRHRPACLVQQDRSHSEDRVSALHAQQELTLM